VVGTSPCDKLDGPVDEDGTAMKHPLLSCLPFAVSGKNRRWPRGPKPVHSSHVMGRRGILWIDVQAQMAGPHVPWAVPRVPWDIPRVPWDSHGTSQMSHETSHCCSTCPMGQLGTSNVSHGTSNVTRRPSYGTPAHCTPIPIPLYPKQQGCSSACL